MGVMTETKTLADKFRRMGARVRIRTADSRSGNVRVDVLKDKKGEFFDLLINAGGDGASTEVSILDVQPEDRHLLLLARTGEGKERSKAKFLCGHDERHWFVAAIPEAAPAHIAQFCVRTGGETVYVSTRYPNGLSQAAFNRLPPEERKNAGFRQMMKDAEVFVRGTIKHADHATITLNGWHRVVMNTENESKAMRHVAFLD